MTASNSTLAAVRCRQCDSSKLSTRGRLPVSDTFAGSPVVSTWDPGWLIECEDCHLVFRHPTLPDSSYAALYAQSPSGVWSNPRPRSDQRLIREFLQRRLQPGSAVLDYGCYDGSFLESIGSGFELAGIEPSSAASALAQRRGVAVIGRSLEDLEKSDQVFDAIVSIDVIEHLSQPESLIRVCFERLKPGGWLVVSTGNAASPSFRMAKGQYWYSAVAEHISFISPAWIKSLSITQRAAELHFTQFQYYQDEARTVLDLLRFGFAASKLSLRQWLSFSSASDGTPPKWTLGRAGEFRDHFMVAMRSHPAPD